MVCFRLLVKKKNSAIVIQIVLYGPKMINLLLSTNYKQLDANLPILIIIIIIKFKFFLKKGFEAKFCNKKIRNRSKKMVRIPYIRCKKIHDSTNIKKRQRG